MGTFLTGSSVYVCVCLQVCVYPEARPMAAVTVCKWELLPNRDVTAETEKKRGSYPH